MERMIIGSKIFQNNSKLHQKILTNSQDFAELKSIDNVISFTKEVLINEL